MLSRLKRTAISFFAVLAAFWVYRLAAEPFIDPPQEEKRVAQTAGPDVAPLVQQNRLGPYLRFFPEGSWERGDSKMGDPKVLESDIVKAVWHEYKVGDGRDFPNNCVELKPCTLLFLPDGEVETPDSRRRVIIMRTKSAVLKFESEVDLSRGQFGKLTGAEIPGEVIIHSAPTRPEGGDDLHVVTRNVRMEGNEIFTPDDVEVQFRFGPSYGSGREMRITLLPSQQTGGSLAPSIGGIQDFKLTREVQMHLQPGASGIMPGDDEAQRRNADRDQPVDIRCTGPFTFDLVAYVAEFHDDVVALRPNDVGPADQLTAGLLSIYFAERDAKPTEKDSKKSTAKTEKTADARPKPNSPSMPRLVPRRFEARGYPVEVRAPSNAIYAIGNRMEYDITTGRISLEANEGSKPVYLKVREANEAEARTLIYQRAPEGLLIGKLHSQGPGWLRARPSEESNEEIHARWTEKLELRPDKDHHLLWIVGNAHVDYSGQGQIEADDICLWLNELPADAAQPIPNRRTTAGDNRSNSLSDQVRARVRPDRLLAQGRVHIESPQLDGDMDELKTWFRTIAAAGAGPASPASSSGAAREDGNRRLGNESRPRQAGSVPEHYKVACRVLETGLLLNGSRSQLEFAVLTDNVKFDQTPPAPGEDSPLGIRGQWLKVERANAADTQVTVLGQPASILAQGMTMRGANVRLDRAANRLWIDGPGDMHWAARPQSAGQFQPTSIANPPRQPSPLANRGPLDVVWQAGMNFDGRTVQFKRGVVAKQTDVDAEQSIRTELLAVTLRGQVDFSNARQRQQQPEVELMTARGKALLENRSFKEGKPVAVDWMQVSDLSVNQITGETLSHGPGMAKSWRYGRRPQLTAQGGLPLSSPRALSGSPNGEPQQDENQITYSQIEFQNGISGNVLEDRRQITFNDQVRGIFGPVPDWQTELIDEDPQPGKMVLHCDRLTVNQMPRAANGSMPMQVDTEGNTHVEGTGEMGDLFTAFGHTLTYDEAKDLLVLRGNSYADAQLHRQERIGAQATQMRNPIIMYSPLQGKFHGTVRQLNGAVIAPPPTPRVTSPPQNPPR